MLIQLAVVTPFFQNCRLIIDPQSRKASVVDPGGDAEKIFRLAQAAEAEIESVFLTHAHLDHAGGVKRLLALVEHKTGKRPLFAAHALEREMRASVSRQAALFGMPESQFEDCPEPDRCLDDGESFSVGTCAGTVLFTPGHSPGHIVLYFSEGSVSIALEDGQTENTSKPVLLAGDTLFAGSIGRTDLPGGSFPVLMHSIKSKLFGLPDETIVLPGHGPETSIGVEKKTNPFLV